MSSKKTDSKKNQKDPKKKNDNKENKDLSKELYKLKNARETTKKKKSFPLPLQPENYIQIKFNSDTGKFYLIDYKNNIFQCNLYGEKLNQFKIDTTGISSYKERLKDNLINEIKFNYNPSEYYHPNSIKFEGYSQFPRPLSLPFVNEIKNPQKMIDEIKKENRFKYSKPSILNLKIPIKDNSCILEYITSRVSEKATFEKEKKIKFYLIKIIDDYIKEKCLENKYNIDFEKTDHNIRTLKNFKNLLKINLNKGQVNGKNYNFPDKNFETNYNITKKVILKNGYRNAHYVPENVNFDLYKKLYSVPGVGSEDNIFKPKNIHKLYNKINKENSKNYDNNNYLKTDSEFNKTYNTGMFSFNQKNLTNSKNVKFNLNDNNNSQNSNLNNITNNNDNSLGNTQSNFYNVTKNNFRSTTTTGFNLTKSNLKQTDNNNTNSENNLSFLSNDSLDENINKKLRFASQRKKYLKTLSDVKNISEYENKMLQGFQIPEIQDQRIFLKNVRPKLKTPGEIFMKEIELLKKVNPLAFKKEEEKEIFDKKVFEKKKKNKQIYERVLHNKQK